MIRTPLLVLALLPAAAAAQAPAAKESLPPTTPSERPATERPALNLRLDNPSSWATIVPGAEKEAAKPLPTLGGDARTVSPTPSGSTGTGPYPKDTMPGR